MGKEDGRHTRQAAWVGQGVRPINTQTTGRYDGKGPKWRGQGLEERGAIKERGGRCEKDRLQNRWTRASPTSLPAPPIYLSTGSSILSLFQGG